MTLSAAILQSRWSFGTVASKLDKLWRAADLAETNVAPGLKELNLHRQVKMLADAYRPTPAILFALKRLFAEALRIVATDARVKRVVMTANRPDARMNRRFGFVQRLLNEVPGVQAIIVYGSSILSKNFADYDVLLIVAQPDAALERLAGTSPTFEGKELNISIYSPADIWVMQLLSGDNLADYGLCLYGEASLPEKPIDLLLARNFSFGIIRQRQQLGMIPTTLDGMMREDDRRSLYGYFVKIPANVVKGTLGAFGVKHSKEQVHNWLLEACGFDTISEQQNALKGRVPSALANSAVATINALVHLNKTLSVVEYAN